MTVRGKSAQPDTKISARMADTRYCRFDIPKPVKKCLLRRFYRSLET
jgi:hypothetical protein